LPDALEMGARGTQMRENGQRAENGGGVGLETNQR